MIRRAISTEGELRPHVILSGPETAPGSFTMTRFCPMADGFGFYGEDCIVILDPPDVLRLSPVLPRSHKTLAEHIRYIQENIIKKAIVVAEDISALATLSDCLVLLDIEFCGKIKDFSPLSHLHSLTHLRLYGSNTLPDLSFLSGMPRLKTFTFSMNVQDGDLRPCLNLSYASCQNKKHYNLKDAQLPKIITPLTPKQYSSRHLPAQVLFYCLFLHKIV